MRLLFASFVLIFSAANAAGLGNLIVDLPGNQHIGVELPITGSISSSAVASIEYRESGASTYLPGPDLLRIDLSRVDSYFTRTDAFAGAIWNLSPGTTYDIRITVDDPSSGTQSVTQSITTRALPAETVNQAPTHIIDSNDSPSSSQIQAILDGAQPGDIIEVRGSHTVNAELYLRASGTLTNPIYLRGNNGTLRTVNDERVLQVTRSHWVVEDLNLFANSDYDNYVVRVRGIENGIDNDFGPLDAFTLRRNHLKGRKGLVAKEGTDGEMRNITIYDNYFEGRWDHPTIVTLKKCDDATVCTKINATWDDSGLKMTGVGHSVFNNTFSGFGDSIKNSYQSAIGTKSIHYHRNKILWGGDDGIELDDAFRNVIASENLIMNTGTGVSKQPNKRTGGPNYAVRNVIVNYFLRPFKFNDGPNGVKAIHNTVVHTASVDGAELAYAQYGGTLNNFEFLNNLFVKVVNPPDCRFIYWTANFVNPQWDGNGYFPNSCSFYIDKNRDTFALAQGFGDPYPAGYAGAAFEVSGMSLGTQPFAAGIAQFGTSWESAVASADVRLTSNSPAATATLNLAGYNSISIGAINSGDALPLYGARTNIEIDTVVPKAPSSLTVQ